MAKERKAKEHKETKYRKRRTSILCAVLSLIVSAAAVVLACTVFFRVESVAVEGNERYSTEEILAAAAVEKGSNLPLTANELLQGRICAALPYIESVKVEKHLPTTLILVVKEAPPVAVIEQEITVAAPAESGEPEPEEPEEADGQGETPETASPETPESAEGEPPAVQDGGWWLLDAKARLLEPVEESGTAGYIKVTGITAVDPEKSKTVTVLQGYEGQLDALIELLQAIQAQGMEKKITEIDLSSPTEVVLIYDRRLRATMLISADFSRKMVIFKQIADLLGDTRQGTVNLKTTDAYYTPGGI